MARLTQEKKSSCTQIKIKIRQGNTITDKDLKGIKTIHELDANKHENFVERSNF